MKPSGNCVLITGGASGIGLALAGLFVKNNNMVIVCGRDQAKLEAAQRSVPGLIGLQADVADASSREQLANAIQSRFSNLNVLINNAGALNITDLTKPQHVEILRSEIAVNLVAPVALTSLLLPTLSRNPNPTIVNVTTGYVWLPSARTAAYSATKTALHIMTEALRFQLRNTPVCVVEVAPPPVDTAMSSHYVGSKATPEGVAQKIYRGLRSGNEVIALGPSNVARILGRLSPDWAFQYMNRIEASWPAPEDHAGN